MVRVKKNLIGGPELARKVTLLGIGRHREFQKSIVSEGLCRRSVNQKYFYRGSRQVDERVLGSLGGSIRWKRRPERP